MNALGRTLGTIVGALVLIVIGTAIYSLPVWLLWNWVIVDVFPMLTSITFLQSMGITLLSLILFKSPTSNKSK